MNEQSKGRLSVATYNVHGWIGRDAMTDHRRTLETVKRLGADVIALQEVFVPVEVGFESEKHDIEALTGMTTHFGPNLEHKGRSYGNAVLTTLDVLDLKEWDLSVPNREPRGALDLRLAKEDFVVRVIATHLGTGLTERDTQIARLIEILGRGPQIPTVLMGDLNEWRPWSRRFSALCRRFERVWWPALSFPVGLPVFALDRIFVRNASVIEPPRAVRTQETFVTSDHLPVRSTIVC